MTDEMRKGQLVIGRHAGADPGRPPGPLYGVVKRVITHSAANAEAGVVLLKQGCVLWSRSRAAVPAAHRVLEPCPRSAPEKGSQDTGGACISPLSSPWRSRQAAARSRSIRPR